MRKLMLSLTLCLTALAAPAEVGLSKEEIRQFLLEAQIVSSKPTSKGVTAPHRLTLSDGAITHEGVFQSIDEHKSIMKFADGHAEINFVDSYKYNIAAYALAELLGLDDMIPVYVERRWNGQIGSLSWVVPVKMDEEERQKRKTPIPDNDAWNKQMYKIRVFDELVYDTDPNLTNILIGDDWKLWRIDFSRAFRLSKDVLSSKNFVKCDRQLFEKLKSLNEAELTQKTKNFLTKSEIQAVMARREKIVSIFQKLIAQKGETEVLY
jgi:hypothetical protein